MSKRKFLLSIPNLISWLKRCVKPLSRAFEGIYLHILRIWGDLRKKHPRGLVLLMLALLMSCAILVLYQSVFQPFEGKLVVRSLSFVNKKSNQLFIERLEDIQKITISSDEQSFNLYGLSDDKSENQFKTISNLRLTPQDIGSRFVVSPSNLKANLKDSKLRVSEIRLQSESEIKRLQYNVYNNVDSNSSISFSIKPNLKALAKPVLQENSEGLDLLHTASLLSLVNFGDDPMELTLYGYKVDISPESEYKSTKDLNQSPLTFYSHSSELVLPLTHFVTVEVELGKDSGSRFWRNNIEVNEATFETFDESENLDDLENSRISTIHSGVIRMAREQVNLEYEQFLQIRKPSGISRLRQLRLIKPSDKDNLPDDTSYLDQNISKDSSMGKLYLVISGNANKIQVGLDPEQPVTTIKSNRLNQFFSKDEVVALFSAMATFIVTALGFAVEDFLEKPSVQPNQVTNTDDETLP